MKPSLTPPARSPGTWDSKERLRIMTKLFSMYPLAGNQTPNLTMRSYLEELADIPALVLSHALHRLTHKNRAFLPSVGEIRAEAAIVIKRAQPSSQGAHAPGYNPHSDPQQTPDPDRWLSRERILAALPAGLREEVQAIAALSSKESA